MYILGGPEVQFKTKVDVFISMHAKEDPRVWKVSARSVWFYIIERRANQSEGSQGKGIQGRFNGHQVRDQI